MREINEIIVHCSATAEGQSFRASDIDTWHRNRGFKKIGYHFVVGLDGAVETGRSLDEVGAHCKGHNSRSIGVCYIGGLRRDGRTPYDSRTIPQRRALIVLLKRLKKKFPDAEIHGHNEYANKACPCFDAFKEYQNLRK